MNICENAYKQLNICSLLYTVCSSCSTQKEKEMKINYAVPILNARVQMNNHSNNMLTNS